MDKLIKGLDAQFADLHRQSQDLVSKLSSELLYVRPKGSADSCGEQLLRSAAVVEQSFGGLTANLWDDPFEWTLPEQLNTTARVAEYLDEVDATRRQAFTTLKSDADLSRQIMTPVGGVELLPFLLDTLQRARHHLQRAFAIFELLT